MENGFNPVPDLITAEESKRIDLAITKKMKECFPNSILQDGGEFLIKKVYINTPPKPITEYRKVRKLRR